MASRAQLSQERSRQRREALLNAAVDLFVQGGSRAVTHRAVASAAGLPSATTTYYFETIDDLLREALNHHIDQWLETLESLTDLDAVGLLSLISQDSAVRFAGKVFAQRPATTATRELTVILGAARDPELRDAAVMAMTKSVDVLVDGLTKVGIHDPEALAEDLVAMIGGIALRRAAGVNSEAEEAVRMVRALRGIVIGHLVDDEMADEVLFGVRERALSGRSAVSP